MLYPTRAGLRALLLGIVVAGGAAEPGSAQTAAAPAATKAKAPAAPPVISPEVHADGRVTFRLRAPKAASVTVTGQFNQGPAAMTKDASGLWSVTIGPVAPDVYEYSFNVDGLAMIDPGNRAIKPMRAPRTSILHLPAQPAGVHDFQDVPHGKVSLHTYRSKSLGRLRPMQVYTPPGYDAAPGRRYPTLYLQHGSGDNEATWVAHGNAHWILDNLIAAGRAQPMIVVMLDGHAMAPGTTNTPEARLGNTVAFERDLLEDAMPYVAANYRTKETPADRAIIGLSMGGGQSLNIGFKHADRFAWVGGMSASVRELPEAVNQGAALNSKLRLLWFACGKDDFLLKPNQDLTAALTAKGVKHTYAETAGAHTWPVWRKYLADFVPLIFTAGK